MKQKTQEKHEKLLELLRSLPQPGMILLDSVGTGLSGLLLRPNSIPQELVGEKCGYSVDLKLIGNDNNVVCNENGVFRLDLRSPGWEQWIKKKSLFTIQSNDVGKELQVLP